MKERKRIGRIPVCSSSNYKESRRVYLENEEKQRQAFLLRVQYGFLEHQKQEEPSPETIVEAWVFNTRWVEMPYRLAKDFPKWRRI